MTDPRKISIEDFDYHLPDARIANYPNPDRDSSKLLVYQKGKISQDTFNHLAAYLPSNSFMVLNNTRVVEARIIFHKPTGARIEIFCLEPGDMYASVTTALAEKKGVFYKCMVGRSSSWPHQTILQKVLPDSRVLSAKIISKQNDHFLVQLSWTPEDLTFAEILHYAGVTPLPPYIKRNADMSDAERYQTVYAQNSGSVAAPTAGLHFTPEVFAQLKAASISHEYVTLHVSGGTFKPVKAESMADHDMHAEFIDVNAAVIEKLISAIDENATVIAVGTTTLRTLESLYWIGLKILVNKNVALDQLTVHQWDPYDSPGDITVKDSLIAVLTYLNKYNLRSLLTKTSLLIAPSYRFKLVDVLITNFHQPRSTLLLLVAAFIGKDWKSVYTYALDNEFRFLSYGDSCLLFRK